MVVVRICTQYKIYTFTVRLVQRSNDNNAKPILCNKILHRCMYNIILHFFFFDHRRVVVNGLGFDIRLARSTRGIILAHKTFNCSIIKLRFFYFLSAERRTYTTGDLRLISCRLHAAAREHGACTIYTKYTYCILGMCPI